MGTNDTIIPDSHCGFTIVLVLIAIVASFLNVLDALPLLNDKFNFPDETNILYGVSSDNLPLGVFSFTYLSWWRPLGFGLPMLISWLFGISALGFHIIALCIHFAVGAALWWFARRLFSTQIAWLSCTFYMLTLSGLALVGFAINSFQDGLFTCLLLLAWGFMFPATKKQDAAPKPYLSSAILLLIAALCKDSWFGVLPVILLTDWLLVRKSSLKDRFKRLAPFLILIPVPILRFVFADAAEFQNVMYSYYRVGCRFVNLLHGLVASFLPFINLGPHQKWYYLLVIPVLAIVVTSLYSGFNRARIILITLMFGSILLILFPSFFNIYWINIRITSLATFSSILLSLALIAIAKLLRNAYLVSFLVILVAFAFYFFMSDIRSEFIHFITG